MNFFKSVGEVTFTEKRKGSTPKRKSVEDTNTIVLLGTGESGKTQFIRNYIFFNGDPKKESALKNHSNFFLKNVVDFFEVFLLFIYENKIKSKIFSVRLHLTHIRMKMRLKLFTRNLMIFPPIQI